MVDKQNLKGIAENVLSLNIQSKEALYLAYMPFLKNRGIFMTTSCPFVIDSPVFGRVKFFNETDHYPFQGKVAWITPLGAEGNRPQGVGIQFSTDQASQTLRMKIEKELGEKFASHKITYTI